jgi:hypothetical protein
MQNSIVMAYDRNISTAVTYLKSNPPERKEVFLPKIE